MHDRPTVLVPIEVLEGESIPEGVPELLENAHVVLLGYHVVPDQTAPGQARMQFEERASKRLDEFEEMLEAAGATVESRLVFTHEGQKTIDRMIYEHDCIAVLVPNATAPPDNILVPVRGTVGVDRLVRTVAGLFSGTDVGITLFHVVRESESDEDARTLLDGVASRLEAEGIDESAIETRIERARKPLDAITRAADEFDAIVMGESDPSIVTFVFGLRTKQLAEQFLSPVVVVQRERPETPKTPSTDGDGQSEHGDG